MRMRARSRYHKIDGWRGYSIPPRAIAGASDTGMAPDSPAPSNEVKAEIARFRAFLKEHGIATRVRTGTSSNVFCGKRWVTVADANDFAKAAQLTVDWMADHQHDTTYIHDADLDDLGYKAGKEAA